MFELSADTLETLTERAPLAFYALMGLSLFAAILGAAGMALFLLIVGATVHVARVGLEGGRHGRRSRIDRDDRRRPRARPARPRRIDR
jgi:hypothetical protein